MAVIKERDISYLIRDLHSWVKGPINDLGILCLKQGLESDKEYDYRIESDLQRLGDDIKNKINNHIDEIKEAFKNWQSKREESVRVIEELNTALRNFTKGTNIAKVTGASVGIAGGIMTIAGLVLIPFTGGLSTVLTVAGIAAGISGGVTSMTASITRLIAEQVKKCDLEAILSKDDEATEQFYKVMIKFTVRIADLKEKFNRTIKDIESVGGFASAARKLSKIYKTIEIFEKLEVFPEIEKAVKIIASAMSAGVISAPAGIMQAFSGWPGAIVECGRLVAGVGAVVGIGLSVVSLVMSAIEIHKGNPSELADAIESNILTKLKEELKFYQDIMNAIQRERA